MAEHELVWTHESDSVTIEAACNAKPDADCRLEPSPDSGCECESFDFERDERGAFHTVIAYDDGDNEVEVRHDMQSGGDCNVCLFLNESDCIEESDDSRSTFEIGRKAIDPVWQGDGFDWKPVGS